MKLILIALVTVALAHAALGLAFQPGSRPAPRTGADDGLAPKTACCEPGCCEPGCCADEAAAAEPAQASSPSESAPAACCGGACPPTCCAPAQE